MSRKVGTDRVKVEACMTDLRDTDRDSSTPLWVKAFAVIALVVFLLVIVVLLTGGGIHGPARHAP